MSKRLKTILLLLLVIDLFVIIPLIIPIQELEGLQPVQQLADPDSLFVEIDGIDFHYKTAGQGQLALILLHGFGASLYSWREVMPLLGEDFSVYAYDRPAFGLTERPVIWTGDNPYTQSASVAQLDSLMDTWGIRQAVLIGNSAGGGVAMQFTLAHPGQVRALILVSPAIGEGPTLIQRLDWLINTPQFQRVGPLLVRRISESGLETIDQAWHDPAQQPADTVPLYTKPLQAENWDIGLWHYATASEASTLTDYLDQFGNLPVLVITGDDDRIVPTDGSIKLAEKIPGAELIVLENCGHVPQEECPQAFLEAVYTFLDHLNP